MTGWRQTILMAVIVGVVAAAAVWYFGGLEATRFHIEVRDYLKRYDDFRLWEAEHGDNA